MAIYTSKFTQQEIDDGIDNANSALQPKDLEWFGKSSTAADTAQKEVSIPSITSLRIGQIIVVQPTVTSTVADSTLKLNSFDAYPMRYNNANITTGSDSIVWNANCPSLFVFDGSYWVFLGHGLDSNTTYSAMSVAEGTAGTKTTARTVRADYLKQIIQAWAPQSDWNATSGNAVILNKPTIPSEVTESTVSGWGFTKNVGTITGIKMNGSSKGTSGVVDLGTVITTHQDISKKANIADLATVATTGSYNDLLNKPTLFSGSYNDLTYEIGTAQTIAGGALSVNGTKALHVITTTANITAVTLSTNPTEGHACHVIFTATEARTVTIAYDATNRVTPKATNVTLNIPANGYVEVNFLSVGGKVYVRGV